MPADQDTTSLIAEANDWLNADAQKYEGPVSLVARLVDRLADALASSAPATNCPACNPSSAGEVGVLPMDWYAFHGRDWFAQTEVGRWWCGRNSNSFGFEDTFFASSELQAAGQRGDAVLGREYPTLDAAKLACQEDYERRVRAVTFSPPEANASSAGEVVAVAWRVKDFADGWILFHSEAEARREAAGAGNLVEPLYAKPDKGGLS